ncbi:CYTH-like domain-containing protein [Thelonectria olida]|uniref:mRNA-capping enzyme subunit beta n=1 Tax=Thelonectria olida TaxID=1576542 RepID=A0A9P8VV90_9HYPO|nr:CYTH-like domain-containing protein [Thelonectria olida]
MDLRSVLNDSGGPAPVKAPPTPKQQLPPQRLQEQPHHRQPQPHPVQSPAQYGYRDYARPPPQPSPGKPPPQDYPVRPHQPHSQLQQSPRAPHPQLQHQQPPTPGAYPPPSPYQTPGPYPPGRAAPPSHQPSGSFHDVRSPSGPAPAPSPYRSATTPSSGGTAGYPFPSQPAPEMNSPVQRHQYPPAQYQPQRRESFSQNAPGPGPGHHQGPYMQHGQHPVPQTPPVGSVGTAHQYAHQRSQSIQSSSTPTSAQSQHQFGAPYAQGSPVAAPRPPPGEYGRPGSQPPTPVGPPMSAGSRQASVAGSYAQQPPSPYQHRLSSTSSAAVAQAQSQTQAQVQSSPRPPPPPTKRISSTYESPVVASEAHQRNLSRSERGQSASVSPKTRVPSLQSNPEHLPPAGEAEARPGPTVQAMVNHSDRGATPAKRKLEDRDLSPRELERKEPRPPPGEINGGHIPQQSRSSQPSSSPVMPRKKRLWRTEPPAWARSAKTNGKLPNNANFVLQKRIHSHINGKQEGSARQSRNASPETTRSHQPSHSQAPPAEPTPQDFLGPWEASITGVKPYEEITKTVADWLFINVINNEDMQEILSRGIQFEIEAKLGTLIDKDTNQRVDRLIDSECVIHDGGRIAFRSSMTEAQHKYFNDFLNQMVIQTDPRAPNGANRVQVHYKHRREIDRFFDLPTDLQGQIPGCVRNRLGKRSKNVRVRVTYDQKTREILNKIIKARVADINIHMPMCPMDCRISINLEMNWDGSVEELEQVTAGHAQQQDRNKDRLSYKHGNYQIDLTQVTHSSPAPGGTQRTEKEHELEIELAPGITIDQGRKAISGAPHRYQELVEGFVDNIRILARKARDIQ